MEVFAMDCPHCGTAKVSFRVITTHNRRDRDRQVAEIFAVCAHCDRCIVGIFPGTTHGRHGVTFAAQPKETHPAPRSMSAPAYTPENADRYFRQGMANVSSNPDASGTMFRKALQTGLQSKFPDICGNLYERIERASERGRLTPELAEWAHQIRLVGNDAAHEEEPISPEEAKQLRDFTALVFYYLFTLPGMLEEFRGTRSPDPSPG